MKTLILAMLIGFTTIACTDRDGFLSGDKLPPITQTGANTFGCRVNGIVFLPNKAIGSTVLERSLWVSGHYDNTQNSSSKITGWRGQNVKNLLYIDVYIFRIDVIGKGYYNVSQAPDDDYPAPFYSYIKCRAVSPSTKQYKLYGTYENSGNIDVTYFSDDKSTMSGTFSGKLREIGGSEEIEVTDGRFDINLKTLQK